MDPSCLADDTHDSALSNLEKWFCNALARAAQLTGRVGFPLISTRWSCMGMVDCCWRGEGWLVSDLTSQSRQPEPERRPRARTTAYSQRYENVTVAWAMSPVCRMAWHLHGRSKAIIGKSQVERVEQPDGQPGSRPAPTWSTIPQHLESTCTQSGMWDRYERAGTGSGVMSRPYFRRAA